MFWIMIGLLKTKYSIHWLILVFEGIRANVCDLTSLNCKAIMQDLFSALSLSIAVNKLFHIRFTASRSANRA